MWTKTGFVMHSTNQAKKVNHFPFINLAQSTEAVTLHKENKA